jgi:hypothetical protein
MSPFSFSLLFVSIYFHSQGTLSPSGDMFEFPEPLFESDVVGNRLCLVCGSKRASRALWTVNRLVVPICEDCRADWVFYDYLILKRIKPKRLALGILKYKLLHPFRGPSWRTIVRDVQGFQAWARTMKRFM